MHLCRPVFKSSPAGLSPRQWGGGTGGSWRPPERDLGLTAGYCLPAEVYGCTIRKGCRKVFENQAKPLQTHERTAPPKQPPTGPKVSGRESWLKPENNRATLPSILLAKVKDLVEVSTLGKALNRKPHTNKASPCAFKHHIHTLPNLHLCCLLAAPGILTPCCANP